MFYLAILSYTAIFGLLAKLAWTDHKLYLLPNVYNAALFTAFLLFHIATGWSFIPFYITLAGAAAGGAFLLILRAVANRALQADAVGLGDVKFIIAAGFGLGIPDIFLVLSLGALFGMAHGFILYHLQRRKTGKPVELARVNVPAGVGFCLAAAVVFLVRFYGWWEPFL